MFLHLYNNKKVEVKCSNFKCITLIENGDKKNNKNDKNLLTRTDFYLFIIFWGERVWRRPFSQSSFT